MNGILLLILALPCAILGIPKSSNQRIVGGSVVNDFEYQSYQFIVSLRYAGAHRCGATAIRTDWALTAAHCVYDDPEMTSYTLTTGATLSVPLVTHNLAAPPLVHPTYNPSSSLDSDIALLQVSQPFRSWIDIASVSMTPQDGEPIDIFGWGATEEGLPPSENLKRAMLMIFNNQNCLGLYENLGYAVFAHHICASSPVGDGTCDGDSGGPMLYGGVVIGVESFSYGCGVLGYPTVYTGVADYSSWILSTVSV